MSYCFILNVLCHVLIITIMCFTDQDEKLISGLLFVFFVSCLRQNFQYIFDPIFIWQRFTAGPVCRHWWVTSVQVYFILMICCDPLRPIFAMSDQFAKHKHFMCNFLPENHLQDQYWTNLKAPQVKQMLVMIYCVGKYTVYLGNTYLFLPMLSLS